jgi:hypothetical protein
MKTTTKTLLRWTLLILMGICAINLIELTIFAQDAATNAPTAGSGDGMLPIFQKLKAVEFLLIPAVTVLIQLLRKFIPQIPASVWPWAAPFIGAILDYAASKAGLWTGNVVVGAMFGGLATWFHQLDKQSVNLLAKITPTSSDTVEPPGPQ